jgi:hypothetical protein
MAERRSAITNEPVGARLGRAFRRNRSQEDQDILDAYRTQTPVDEIRRRRAAAATPSAARSGRMSDGMAESAEASPDAVNARLATAEAAREAARLSNMDADASVAGPGEMRTLLNQRRAQRQPRPNNARMTPRAAAPREMTADELNDLSLRRGAGGEGVDQALAGLRIQQRLADMGGSGDIGAASARARGEQVGPPGDYNMKKGGKVAVKKMKAGGVVKSSASNRGDGCAARGKTKGRMV